MTRKERERLGEELKEREGAMMGEKYKSLLARIFRNEMVKLMEANGCFVEKRSFTILRDESVDYSPYHMAFITEHGDCIASYSFRMTESYDDWKKNKVSLVATMEEKNQFAKYERGDNDADGCTFLQFVKSIKEFCMLNNMYQVERDKKGGLSVGEKEAPPILIPEYAAPEYEPYDGEEYF